METDVSVDCGVCEVGPNGEEEKTEGSALVLISAFATFVVGITALDEFLEEREDAWIVTGRFRDSSEEFIGRISVTTSKVDGFEDKADTPCSGNTELEFIDGSFSVVVSSYGRVEFDLPK